jgi:hypothetical protein
MRWSGAVNRYVLVERSTDRSTPEPARVRRFSLARVAVTPRSALGEDRHERLEQVAGMEEPRSGDT